jgi:hypothetical protein
MKRHDWIAGKVNDWRERYKVCEECGKYLPLNGSCFHGPEIPGERVAVGGFEIVANPVVRWNDVGRRRFNAIDRTQERMRQAVEEE